MKMHFRKRDPDEQDLGTNLFGIYTIGLLRKPNFSFFGKDLPENALENAFSQRDPDEPDLKFGNDCYLSAGLSNDTKNIEIGWGH